MLPAGPRESGESASHVTSGRPAVPLRARRRRNWVPRRLSLQMYRSRRVQGRALAGGTALGAAPRGPGPGCKRWADTLGVRLQGISPPQTPPVRSHQGPQAGPPQGAHCQPSQGLSTGEGSAGTLGLDCPDWGRAAGNCWPPSHTLWTALTAENDPGPAALVRGPGSNPRSLSPRGSPPAAPTAPRSDTSTFLKMSNDPRILSLLHFIKTIIVFKVTQFGRLSMQTSSPPAPLRGTSAPGTSDTLSVASLPSLSPLLPSNTSHHSFSFN